MSYVSLGQGLQILRFARQIHVGLEYAAREDRHYSIFMAFSLHTTATYHFFRTVRALYLPSDLRASRRCGRSVVVAVAFL